MGKILHAIAYPQDGEVQIKDTLVCHGRVFVVDTGGPARKDNPPGRERAYLVQTHIAWMDLTVDLSLTHPSGNKLGILGSKV